MGKTVKPKKEEEAGGGSTDFFKSLFGRDSTEEVGFGLISESKSCETEAQIDVSDSKNKKKKKRKEKATNHDSDAETPNSNGKFSQDTIEVKKRKSEKRVKSPNLVVESVGTDTGKKRNKEKENEIEKTPTLDINELKKRKTEIEEGKQTDMDVVFFEKKLNKLEEKKKQKKRKRDEIEEEYEARVFGIEDKGGEKNENTKSKRIVGEKRKSVDDPAEMMVSNEGFDDESKLLRTIFVGNLPLKIKKKSLLKEFSSFGEVESVRIRSVPILDGKLSRKDAIITGKINDAVDSVHAYIVFKDEKSAQASLSHNMATVGGNHIRVDMACPPRKKLKGESTTPLYDHKRSVFVGNLPFDVKDEELYKLFCGISQLESSVEAVRVIRDPHTSLGKGIAYVLLKTRDAAHLLVKKKHVKLRDRELRLYHAKSESVLPSKRTLSEASTNRTPSKRLAMSPGGDHSVKPKANLSYQGLQATKSGVQKKERTGERRMQNIRTESSGPERKVREVKRPAVAARKAKALKAAMTPKQGGIKRKMVNRTPDKFNKNKKPRKFR